MSVPQHTHPPHGPPRVSPHRDPPPTRRIPSGIAPGRGRGARLQRVRPQVKAAGDRGGRGLQSDEKSPIGRDITTREYTKKPLKNKNNNVFDSAAALAEAGRRGAQRANSNHTGWSSSLDSGRCLLPTAPAWGLRRRHRSCAGRFFASGGSLPSFPASPPTPAQRRLHKGRLRGDRSARGGAAVCFPS